MAQPLTGLLVLDFTTLLPGPLATLMLAEAGAEVIKIERPGGEDMRRFPPLRDGESAAFALLNRGKRSLVLDLKSPEDQKQLQPLLQRADILVEQFRPGVMARLASWLRGRAKDQSASSSIARSRAMAKTGPRSPEAGHDINYIGNTGLLALQPGPAGAPVVPPALVADIAGGTFPAVINILLALRQRETTGEGCHLDIAMTDAMFAFAWHALAEGMAAGRFPGPGEGRVTGASARYQLYPTRDGKLVACGALEEHFWRKFTAAIGLDAKFVDDACDPAASKAAIAAIIASKSADEWQPILAAADCCATIVMSLEEALRDPHFVARGLFAHQVANAAGAIMPALPLPIAPQFRDSPQNIKPAPPLGGD